MPENVGLSRRPDGRACWSLHGLPAAAVALLLLFHAPAFAGSDVANGQKIFKRCAVCHSLKPGKKKVGPSLHGVFGREAGTMDGFRYSKAMKQAGKDGLEWSAETLDKYLSAPKKFVPGNRMPFPGLKDAGKRADVIAYLKEATKK